MHHTMQQISVRRRSVPLKQSRYETPPPLRYFSTPLVCCIMAMVSSALKSGSASFVVRRKSDFFASSILSCRTHHHGLSCRTLGPCVMFLVCGRPGYSLGRTEHQQEWVRQTPIYNVKGSGQHNRSSPCVEVESSTRQKSNNLAHLCISH